VNLALEVRNVEPAVCRRLLANAIEDIPPGVFAQLARWARADRFDSEDGSVDHRARLAGCRQPALFVAAPRDGLAPPEVVRIGCELWGGEKQLVVAGRADGFRADYGHTDLLCGRHAPEEIFPRVRDWLLAHAGGKAGAGD
jgi:pimeloyl-ACP methyl ester carboxylesterase